jgi:8-oxo-dGTP pyrophosphatase MutT (NUDIX family)
VIDIIDLKNKEWRNDVKDYLYNNIKIKHTRPVIIKFLIKEINEYIEIKTNRPDLIYGVTYLLLPKSYKNRYEGLTIINPISNEGVYLYFSNIRNPKMGIPAHNNADYTFALKHTLPMRQVIMPVNASLDDNKPRDDKEWVFRNNVVLVVKHWREDKYLYIDYNNQKWKCLIQGGIEEGETIEEASIRELEEESGYYDIKGIRRLPFKMANVFYAAHKGVNRYSIVDGCYIELKSGKQKAIDEKEKEEHTAKWATKEELFEVLKNGFNDQIWLTKQALNEVKAYTGHGKMINSEFINEIEDREEAMNGIIEYIVSKNLGYYIK